MKIEAQQLRVADLVRLPHRGEFEVAKVDVGDFRKVRVWARGYDADGDLPPPHSVFDGDTTVEVSRPGDLFDDLRETDPVGDAVRLAREILGIPEPRIEADDLAQWVNMLAECDDQAHWCPDLAGLIACAPEGLLDKRVVEYGRCAMRDDGDGVQYRRLHPWTVDSIARWAVIPYAWLDVCEGYPVPQELGEVLLELDGCELEPETRDDLDEVLACLWDILIDPDLIERTMVGDRAEARRLQFEALASIGVWS